MRNDWFEADTWPLEAAIAWLLYGDKRLSGSEATKALGRRRDHASKPLTFRAHLLERDKKVARCEVSPGSLYRAEMRDALSAQHRINRAIKQVLSILRSVRPATGSNGTQRTPISPKLWKLARLVDDQRLGLILRTARESTAWRHIDVPAAPFRRYPAKRGRRPLGLGPKAPGGSIKTSERIHRNERRIAGLAYTETKGRPRGSRNVHP